MRYLEHCLASFLVDSSAQRAKSKLCVFCEEVWQNEAVRGVNNAKHSMPAASSVHSLHLYVRFSRYTACGSILAANHTTAILVVLSF